MAEASASAIGHLVVIAIKLADSKETNGHRYKVLAKSFKSFPTLVREAEELNEFQSDAERLLMEQKAIEYVLRDSRCH